MQGFAVALSICLLFAEAAAPLFSAPIQARLEAGELAPDFALAGSDGKTYRLSDYRGKRAVVIAWFARAFSAG